MKRRSLVALVAASVLVFLGIVAVSTVLFLTRTTMGRERLRAFIHPLIARSVKGGTIYLGHLSGNFLSQVTIDSLAIRDARGDLFVSTGRVTLDYNPRDLIDYRIFIRRATIEHPYVHIVQHTDGTWNFKQVFASKAAPNLTKEVSSRGWGNYFVVDSARLHDASFLLTLPWHPDEALKGARRDSAIKAALTNPARAVSKTYDGYGRLYAWHNTNGLIAHARLADPDSDEKFGREFTIATLSADELEPTFKYRKLRGDVRILGDSVWFQSPHFEMPASVGRGAGKVWWGSDLPVRYDIVVHGDSVSLDDVNWVYPPLPRTGGGSVDLAIRNDPKNLQILDFRLSNMDVRTTGSHVTGGMWFGIGQPVLLVRNVDLKADPVDFDFLRTINQKPFPVDWRGQLFGTVKGRGGPLTHFLVDDAQVTFRDAHVPGATSRFSGKGELDILYPALTAFHGFNVNASTVDLRTIEYLYPAFPRLRGTVYGTATLDSSWLDVRFSNADVYHQDGPGEPSHVTGNGRITYGDPFMTYDVNLDARPVSLTMLARSYPNPLRGVMSGPVRAQGQSPDLSLTTTLAGDAGTFSFDGRLDLDTTGGWGAKGRGQFSSISPATLLAKAGAPAGTFSGHYDVDVNAQSASSIRGSGNVSIERTVYDGVTIYPSQGHVTFADGRMTVDSLRVETTAGTLHASGAIGLPKSRGDSLGFHLDLDSLGGLRRYLASADSGAAADSLAGRLSIDGFARGRLDSLRLHGTLTGDDFYFAKYKTAKLNLDFDVENFPNAASGTLKLSVDSTTLGGVTLDTLGGVLVADDASHARFTLGAKSRNGPLGVASGTWGMGNGGWDVALASLDLVVGKDEWRLAGPARVARDSIGMRLDSLVLRNRDTAVIALSGNIPDSGSVVGRLRAAGLPLGDVGVLEQFTDTIAGTGRLAADLAGTRARPQLTAAAAVAGLTRHSVTLDSVTAQVDVRNRFADVAVSVVRNGGTAATGTAHVPVEFRLFGLTTRNDSLRGEIKIDSTKTDLSIIQLALGSLKDVTGQVGAHVAIGGTINAPVFNDTVNVRNGAVNLALANVKLTNLDCTLIGAADLSGGDTLNVSKCSAVSAGTQPGTIALRGSVKNIARFFLTSPSSTRPGPQPSFNLSVDLTQFHAYNRRSVADVYATTQSPIQITGDLSAPRLTGAVRVDRSAIFLPDRDLARKLSFVEPTFGADTTQARGLAGFTQLERNLTIPSFTVTLGSDVRLKSKEADVPLAGSLNVVKATGRSARTFASSNQLLGLEGILRTVGGTYTLDLGLARREFQVLPDGSVTFTGDYQNPTLDIAGQYNVKQYRDRDLPVIVHLRGPLIPYPELSFTTTADYAVSESDLVSYLITGMPGFELTNQTREVLAQFIGPTVSAVTANSLRNWLGSGVDAFRFELGGNAQTGTSTSTTNALNFQQYLWGATIGVEKQFADKAFLSVNTGLCQFDPSYTSSNFSALSGLGAKVEYRFRPSLSTQIAYDPATAARTCSAGQSLIGVVPTPQQFSLSLHHTWRF